MAKHRGGYGREHVLRVAEVIRDKDRGDPQMGCDKAASIAGTALATALAMGLIPRGPEGESYDARLARRGKVNAMLWGMVTGAALLAIGLVIGGAI